MDAQMRIQLVRKLADQLDGVDVSRQRVGDVVDLPRREAELLVAEGWARPAMEKGGGREAERDKTRKRSSKRPAD